MDNIKLFKVRWWLAATNGDPEGTETVQASSKEDALRQVLLIIKARFPHKTLAENLKMEVIAQPEPDSRDAEIAQLKATVEKLTKALAKSEKQQELIKHGVEMREVQRYEEHQNSMMLYRTLAKHAPTALNEVKPKLYQSVNEYDKSWSDLVRRNVKLEAVLKPLGGEYEALLTAEREGFIGSFQEYMERYSDFDNLLDNLESAYEALQPHEEA